MSIKGPFLRRDLGATRRPERNSRDSMRYTARLWQRSCGAD